MFQSTYKTPFNPSLNPNYKTSICKYAYVGCKQQKNCWYAHNKDELRQRVCLIGNNCKDSNCCYIHPNQNIDKNIYYMKILLKSDILGINKGELKNQLEMLSNPIVVELDINDESDSEIDNDIELLSLETLKIDDKEPEPTNEHENKIELEISNEPEIEDIRINEYQLKKPIKVISDEELKNYINEFRNEWLSNPEQFYEKNNVFDNIDFYNITDKNNYTINIKTNGVQLDNLIKYMKMLNIDFNLNKNK